MGDLNRLLITGAAGALGHQLRSVASQFARHVRLTDRKSCSNLQAHEEDCPADLADFKAVEAAVQECDAIVHLGGQPVENTFDVILDSNIRGTYNVYETARRHGVKRIIYASSVHAVGFYERNQTIDAMDPVRPDSLYGVSKVFAEGLSRYYFDKFGIETVCLRIGSCFPEPTDRRHLITWLSYRDFAHLVEVCLTAPRVGHTICFATSNNNASFWDNRAASVLGYKPQDSADLYREKVFAMTDRGQYDDPSVRYQGGNFSAAGHFEDPRSGDGK